MTPAILAEHWPIKIVIEFSHGNWQNVVLPTTNEPSQWNEVIVETDADNSAIRSTAAKERDEINCIADKAAAVRRELRDRIFQAKSHSDPNAIPLETRIEIDRLNAFFTDLYFQLRPTIERVWQKVQSRFDFSLETDEAELLSALDWFSEKRSSTSDFVGLIRTFFNRRAIDESRKRKRRAEVTGVEDNYPDLPDISSQGSGENNPQSVMGAFNDRSFLGPAAGTQVLSDDVHRDLLLYIAGAADSNDTSTVTQYEARNYSSRERRYFSEQECRHFQIENKKTIWVTIKRKYWMLLREQDLWQRVTFPAQSVRVDFPDLWNTWQSGFAVPDLGTVIAAVVMGGWIFFDDSQHWFELLEEFGFSNSSAERPNFLAVSMLDPKNVNSSKSRYDTFSILCKMCNHSRQTLQSHWDSWKSANRDVWYHMYSENLDDPGQSTEVLEIVKQRGIENCGFFQSEPLPMTAELTRSFLAFADLPCDSKYYYHGNWKTYRLARHEHQLKFQKRSQ